MKTLYLERSTGECRDGKWVEALDLEGVERIVVGTGPGSFAGIRSALAFAQGYALGRKCEVLGLPSACALAGEGRLAVVGDARQGKTWIALFDGCRLEKDVFQVNQEELPESIPAECKVVTPDAKRLDVFLRETFGERYLGGRVPTGEGLRRFAEANPSVLKPEPLPIYLNPAVRQPLMKNLILMAAVLAAAIAGAKDVDVRDFGAKGDGATFDTEAVQKAIDDCSAAGGGRVTLAGGTFLVKPIMLKSGVDLHLDVTARLLGSPDWKDYPNRGTFRHVDSSKLPRARDAALIAADEQERIAISGRGVIDANGMSFVRPVKGAEGKKWQYERIGGFDQSPPRVVFFTGCRDVTVTDVTMTNQPAGWSYWIHDCDRVVFDRCKVLADVRFPNNDGIHVNSSRDVSISNCRIETGDDSVVVRCNNRSLRENKVCARVTVANCQLRSYANCIRLGWCQEGVIRDCAFSNLVLHDSSVGINIWFVPQDWNAAGDWGREKTLIENISFSGIVMDRIHGYPITVRVFDPAGFDAVRNVSFANMTCKSYGLPQFWGARGRPLEDFSFSNCRFIRDAASVAPWETAKPFDKPGENPFLHCRNFSFNGVSIDE